MPKDLPVTAIQINVTARFQTEDTFWAASLISRGAHEGQGEGRGRVALKEERLPRLSKK